MDRTAIDASETLITAAAHRDVGKKAETLEKATFATAHVLRFREPMSAERLEPSDGPKSALAWFFGPNNALDETGYLRDPAANVWGGVALYRDRADALAILDNPFSAIPSLTSVVEAWHVALVPFSHRGEVNWLRRDHLGEIFESADDPVGEGPLIVLTTAGYLDDANLDRVRDFDLNVERVRDWMEKTADGMVMQHVFESLDPDMDGPTFSVWRDEEALRDFAYRPGIHREQVDRFHAEHTADRVSFTRFRPIRSVGTWNGEDPLAPT